MHELALLVALVKGPTYYDPWRHPQRALERRNLVLQLMADSELITVEQVRKARASELDVWDRETAGVSYYPAYLQLVRSQLAEQYRDEDLTTQGLRVFTAPRSAGAGHRGGAAGRGPDRAGPTRRGR